MDKSTIIECIKDLEEYRKYVYANKGSSEKDWTIRACQARLAKLAGINGRNKIDKLFK